MTLYRLPGTDKGVEFAPDGGRWLTYPDVLPGGPTLTPRALNARLVVTGHSIHDAVFKYPWAGVILDAGLTPAIWSSTGPYATASIRWNDRPASPDEVRGLMEAGGADYDVFIGIEAHGGDYGSSPSRASVQTHYQYSDARGYALLWHNLAASTGAQPFYANFWRDDTTLTFGAAWRASHTVVIDASDANLTEPQLWDSIIDHVNANRAVGTPAMRLVPWLQVFLAIYDAIQLGTVTGVTMADFFGDNVHPSNRGRWAMLAALMYVVYHRHPNELSNTVTLEFSGSLTIDSGLAAQLRPIIAAACEATPRTGVS